MVKYMFHLLYQKGNEIHGLSIQSYFSIIFRHLGNNINEVGMTSKLGKGGKVIYVIHY